ncbi:serine/threonine-protein kinase [Paraliomyxa miuraensis]|uniref:serine/threonine-protein kinase n=1 Tax=Paraliomyxa miuraensis TaxID=376150 RepID=UPI0022512D6F|nr:serine/threonine-protein kinase [Paraliomyxa miuraensis]MCX4240877.1 serine/threonine protein kinase [Paraliomyxa miuraensis]
MIGKRYRLTSPLGVGGVGEVWAAEDVDSGRSVAVKLMLPTNSLERRARFMREGRLSLALEHPHIVQAIELGDDHGAPFMVMELLSGPSLEDLVEQGGPLPWARVEALLVQMCEALAHAHAHGVVHHDIKPSNIVLANHADQPDHGKLVDFGIARRNLDDEPNVELTSQGQLLGSPGYMSPEQIRGQRSNPCSDQYGLACTAFYLLTGRDPFEAHTVQAQVYATLYGKRPPLTDIDADPAVVPQIQAMLHHAMAKDPADRFESMSVMAEAIATIG